ncbi:hypothetical protein GOODEAATRI_010448 [Goodea atripinnis]|uniref:Uncharacterized protein n=1 Tax=Goodea atripinnis TaxID=208336 RepID=A0ABV0N3E0_9TELE
MLRTPMFLYPPASQNFSDVSQKRANRTSSSIRTMKSHRPIRRATEQALANGGQAPSRVMLSELKTEDTAYRLCSLIDSHCRALRSSDSQLVSIVHTNILSVSNDENGDNNPEQLTYVFALVEHERMFVFLEIYILRESFKNDIKIAGFNQVTSHYSA